MRAKQFFISTQKEAPADAEIVSQKLMLRAGMIRKLAAGVYNYMPMGLRSLKKIERIVREEMDRAGAIELLMPIVQPAELWQETGRWQKYGSELLRFKDRHDRDFVLQPTSEEVVTDIARQEVEQIKHVLAEHLEVGQGSEAQSAEKADERSQSRCDPSHGRSGQTGIVQK